MKNSQQGQITVINDPQNYGLSISWLLATLGAKKSRKLVKKDIAGVCISKTCESIDKPTGGLSLRTTSNLLYGVSVLYRQQVDYLLGDVGNANNRLKDLHAKALIVNIGGNVQRSTRHEEARGGQILLEDDQSFVIEQDFPLSFQDDVLEAPMSERMKNQAELMKIERQINQVSGIDLQHSLFKLDEEFTAPHFDETQDTSFFGISNIDFDLEEPVEANETLGFEFNDDGDIVEHIKFDLPDKPADLNLDEEVLETVEDPHFSTTEMEPTQLMSMLNKELSVTIPRNKKRKIRIDLEVTINEYQYHRNWAPQKRNDETLKHLLATCSEFSPRFLNLAYKHIFGSELTALVSMDRFPNKRRHGDYGIEIINSIIENTDHVEVARDLEMLEFEPRFTNDDSANLVDLGDFEQGRGDEEEDDDEYDIMLEFSALEQRSRVPTRQRMGTGSDHTTDFGPMTRTMYKFLKFIIDRSEQYGNIVSRDQIAKLPLPIGNEERPTEYHKICLDQLIPDSRNAVSVSRKIAAKSFSSLLELATRDMVTLSYDPGHLSTPKEIEIYYCC